MSLLFMYIFILKVFGLANKIYTKSNLSQKKTFDKCVVSAEMLEFFGLESNICNHHNLTLN